MSLPNRRLDHWTTSLDAVEALRLRMSELEQPDGDPIARQLMAQVAHAKSSSFIALLDPEGQVLDVNPAALIAGGVDRAEVIGLPLWTTAWWSMAPAGMAETTKQAITGAARGQFARFDVDVRIESAGRTTGTLDLLLRPLRGRDGQVAFVVAEGRAITDRKRVEQRLARQNAELSALTQRLARVHDYRERLLGELSHDLRAPLQVVITRSEQLLRTADSGAQTQLVNIRLAALGALEQINDMLEQVKADHGEATLSLVDADLALAIRTVAEQFEPLAEDRDVILEIETPARVTARFDVERVSRIVSNLLANAIRHTPVGGSVRCALDAGDGAAALSVADSGPGVPEEHRDKIFGRFRSGLDGDGRSAGAGAGLGLAIVREFVELHGGEISLSDAPEGGALFTVMLPLRPPEGERIPATLAQQAAAAQRTEFVRSHLEAELAETSTAPRVPTVVIVERVPGRADTILAGIDESTVTCVAEDALEALRLALELLPDAVVVGTATGDLSPTSLLRRLAANERLMGVRRVALAGEREEDPSPESLIAAGAQLVLPAVAAEELGGRLWAAATAAER
ncbi:PAS domain-containing sensor histidine kinase [Solirubrobacter ginsenosidimutans]|uniref:histidine kinase n=1 Tax=Solirubrobacter ginsenosidimutans TaxID=490573 RepID=A0A9X3MZ29_9ACTN|nr:PAS domain-containing sensor histidine kinase [Solirubrobacter ginsenosidimutans]MDA0165430.1 PAS domain-containing sensor histidine kinase [Solirubrobacter ginsenosidimutans]